MLNSLSAFSRRVFCLGFFAWMALGAGAAVGQEQKGELVAPKVAVEAAAVDASAPAVPGAEEPAKPENDTAAVAARRAAVEAELVAARAAALEADKELAALASEATATASNALLQLEARAASANTIVARLKSLDSALRKQADLLATDDATTAASGAADAPDSPDSPDEPSAFALNGLKEALREERERVKALNAAAEAARASRKKAEEKLEVLEREQRLAERQKDEAAAVSTSPEARTLAGLDLRLAAENVNRRNLEVTLARQGASAAEAAVEVLLQRIETMRVALIDRVGDDQQLVEAVASEEVALGRLRDERARELATIELQLSSAQKRYSSQANAAPALLAEVESLATRREASNREITLIDARLERVSADAPIWERWAIVLRGGSLDDEAQTWDEETDARIDELRTEELRRRGSIEGLRARISAYSSDLEASGELGSSTAALKASHAALSRLLEAEIEDARDLAASRRLAERLGSDIADRSSYINPLTYIRWGWRTARDVWNSEITVVDDQPITAGAIVIALFLASGGMVLSRRLSGTIGRQAVARLGIDRGAASALQTIAFYALLVSSTLLALRMVNFPLTAFTVLGGALAIGVGFGSQNVMNNFISGLILMLERPIRAADVVEIDGTPGTVEAIGARSTQIRATDGRHLIVPNSFFLESNVVNWTLSDDLIRDKVTVGVAYGSPARVVESLIREAVDNEEDALPEPAPVVIFQDFGDNALIFDVYFWMRARSPMEVRKVQSKVRFRIDELFAARNIVIAFPQRDVHIDSLGPLDVRMLPDSDRSKDS